MPIARSSDGVEIAYRVVGETAPNVLFMHGWAGSGAYFDETLKHLDLSSLRAITFDFRGHGDSGASDAYGLDDLAADTLAAADDSDAETFVLVGFSMSGKFAQYVSCRNPQRVLGQILVGGASAEELPMPPKLLDEWYSCAGSAQKFAALLEPFLTRPVEPEVKAAFARAAAKASRTALEGTMGCITSTSFADELEAASAPTLVVGGLRDELFTPEVLRRTVVAPLRNSRLALLDCGHEIPLELPREFAALIEAFLAALA